MQQAILKEHSKQQTMRIVNFIGTNTQRMAELMDLFLEGDSLERQRAAWVVYHFTPEQQSQSKSYFEQLLNGLTEEVHPAVWRATLRLFHRAGIPERLEGRIVSLAFDVLADPTKAIATKVYAMSILGDFCKKEPDLAGELRLLIEEQWPHSSAGFKSRGRKILKMLEQLGL